MNKNNETIFTYEDDYIRLTQLGIEKLSKLFYIQIKNIWRVDGLYFQGIEKRFGSEYASEIDKETWSILAKIEARDLKKLFNIENITCIKEFMNLLLNTSWALYQSKKSVEIDEENNIGIFKVLNCKVQEARIKKGLKIFPCKSVRYSYLKAFTNSIDNNMRVEVLSCPPDEKPRDFWCGWKFILELREK